MTLTQALLHYVHPTKSDPVTRHKLRRYVKDVAVTASSLSVAGSAKVPVADGVSAQVPSVDGVPAQVPVVDGIPSQVSAIGGESVQVSAKTTETSDVIANDQCDDVLPVPDDTLRDDVMLFMRRQDAPANVER